MPVASVYNVVFTREKLVQIARSLPADRVNRSFPGEAGSCDITD